MTVGNAVANNYGVRIVDCQAIVLDAAMDPTLGILVGVAGNVNITFSSGATATIPLAAGIWHPICATKISTSGTTATGIFAGY